MERGEEPLLELVPNERLSLAQEVFRSYKRQKNDGVPLYRLVREPSDLSEIDWKNHREIDIWRENGTMICVGGDSCARYSKPIVCFAMNRLGGYYRLSFAIYGDTDADIAETATFFWSLLHSGGDCETRLEILEYNIESMFHFDVSALGEDQLASILDSNPTRCLDLQGGIWSAEQSTILATRSYPLNLRLAQPCVGLDSFNFEDDGTAFVNALEARQTSFGSLYVEFDDAVPFSAANLRRLLKLEIFDSLALFLLNEEFALSPLSTKVNTLDYAIRAKYLRPEDFDALDIAAKDLSLRIYMDDVEGWENVLVSFFDRVAILGHFKRLRISLDWWGDSGELDWDALAPVAKALIRAIRGKPKLSCLDLSDTHHIFFWAPHLKDIFEAMEEHEGMRTFLVIDFEQEDVSDEVGTELLAPDYSWLEKLLSKNRKITVLDCDGKTVTNGSSIDAIYALNRFYNGSADLVKESSVSRPLLVATALVESASGKFQRTALLLADHTDVLCEFMLGANLEESVVSQPAPETAALPASKATQVNQIESSKRKMSIQPSEFPAAKKATSNEN